MQLFSHTYVWKCTDDCYKLISAVDLQHRVLVIVCLLYTSFQRSIFLHKDLCLAAMVFADIHVLTYHSLISPNNYNAHKTILSVITVSYTHLDVYKRQ